MLIKHFMTMYKRQSLMYKKRLRKSLTHILKSFFHIKNFDLNY